MKSQELKNTILYIDDEQANLDGFKFNFRKDFNIYLANTVQKAFEIINKNKIKVVISDNRMPDMMGTEFFEVLSISHPDIIRILVTAYADTEAVMQAINKGKVYRFITKPWNKDELKVTIDNAFESYNLKYRNNELIQDLTNKNKELEELNFRLMIEVAERSKAEEELALHRNNLQLLVKQRTEEIDKINRDLAFANHELIAVNEELNAINEELESANNKLSHEIQVRNKVQDLLAESENKYRGLIEQSSEGIMIINLEGHIIECNKAVGNIFEVDYKEIINTFSWDFDQRYALEADKKDEIKDKNKKLFYNYILELDQNKTISMEGYQETSKGNIKYIVTVLFSVITPRGKFIGKIFRDFTDKKNIENSLRLYQEELEEIVKERTAQLKESEQRLRTISDNMPGGAIFHGYTDHTRKNHLIYASAISIQISGIAYEKLIENIGLFIAKIHPLDITRFNEIWEKSLKSLEVMDIEIRYSRSQTEILWLQIRTMFKKGADNNIWWDGYVIDITKRKLTEKAAQERDSVINNIQEGIAAKTGEKLFETVVLKLSETLNADYTFIGEIVGDSKEIISTIAFSDNLKIIPNIEYKIINTPSSNILKQKVYSCSNNIRTLFPDDNVLKNFQIEGYIGVALFDSHEVPIGVMISLFTLPLEDTLFAGQMLKIFSARVGAEIERIRANSELKEREERFRTLFELTPNMMLISKVEGTILECNSAFERISEFSRSEIIGKSPIDFNLWSKEYHQKIYNIFNIEGRVRNIEISFATKKGQVHYALLSLEPVIIHGETTIISTITDISERKKSEEAIQQYSDIAQNMQVALIVFYLEDQNEPDSMIIVKVNPAAEKIMKIKADELVGNKIFKIFPVLKKYNIDRILSEVIITGTPYENEEFRYFMESGDVLFFSAKAFKMPNYHVGVLFEDITQRKKVEHAVKENEERYHALFDKSPNGIHLVGTNGEFVGKLVSANPKVIEMLGYEESELIGMSIDSIIRDFDLDDKVKWTEKLMKGETINYETNFYCKNNSYFPVEVTASIISIEDQLYILGIDRDISERKLMEGALRESERKLLNIFNSSSDGILITDFNLNILDVNKTLLNIIGYESFELLAKQPIEIILPEYRGLIDERIKNMEVGERLPSIEIEISHKNNHVIPVEINSRIISHGGKPSILAIIRDITDRKEMEKKLFETIINTEEKERERFAGDLHDEVGPLLSSLKMYISLIAETEDKKKKQYIIPQIQTLIKEAITSVREISNDLSPHVLNNYGCVAAINSFLGLKRDFLNITFSQNLENRRFEQIIEVVLYRIIKELVNNTIKHAKASTIEIKLYEEDTFIKLHFFDNGIGFDINETVGNTAGSIGLLNIMSRIKTVNGKSKISTAQGQGFTFELFIPLEKT